MESKIKRLFLQDCTVVLVFTGILWMILLYMLTMVIGIAPNHIVKTVITVAGVAVAAFATASSIAALVHLKKNQTQIYTEEITASLNK